MKCRILAQGLVDPVPAGQGQDGVGRSGEGQEQQAQEAADLVGGQRDPPRPASALPSFQFSGSGDRRERSLVANPTSSGTPASAIRIGSFVYEDGRYQDLSIWSRIPTPTPPAPWGRRPSLTRPGVPEHLRVLRRVGHIPLEPVDGHQPPRSQPAAPRQQIRHPRRHLREQLGQRFGPEPPAALGDPSAGRHRARPIPAPHPTTCTSAGR